MLDDRKLDVLKAIVTDYVSSKEPVGSKALVERHGLRVSPATVRNDMAVLEEEGYVTHPHTSAGRIPTDKGYRLFVDRIATLKPLSGPERRAIQAFMTGAVDLDDIVRRTVRLLAQITHQVAIMQYPVATTATIRHLELVSLSTDRILIVLIMSSGSVEQRIVELPGHDEQNLVALSARLNRALVGLTVAEAVDSLNRLLDELGPAEGPRATSVVATVLEILAVDPSARVVVAGVPNLTAFGAQWETTVRPAVSKSLRRSEWVASREPLPGRERPRASVRQFIELAVNMPEHDPQVGQALASMISTSESAAVSSPAAIMASMRSSLCSPSVNVAFPASIGPPETKMVGMLRRMAAINMPGVILSQLEMHTRASAQ